MFIISVYRDVREISYKYMITEIYRMRLIHANIVDPAYQTILVALLSSALSVHRIINRKIEAVTIMEIKEFGELSQSRCRPACFRR